MIPNFAKTFPNGWVRFGFVNLFAACWLWVAFLLVGVAFFGSRAAFSAWFHGARLWSEVQAIDLGSVPCGDRQTVWWPLHNLTNRPVVIVGAQTSCDCAVVDEMPKAIAPNSVAKIGVRVRIEDCSFGPDWEQSVRLFDDGGMETIALKVTCRIVSR